jgi:hypothetical protein
MANQTGSPFQHILLISAHDLEPIDLKPYYVEAERSHIHVEFTATPVSPNNRTPSSDMYSAHTAQLADDSLRTPVIQNRLLPTQSPITVPIILLDIRRQSNMPQNASQKLTVLHPCCAGSSNRSENFHCAGNPYAGCRVPRSLFLHHTTNPQCKLNQASQFGSATAVSLSMRHLVCVSHQAKRTDAELLQLILEMSWDIMRGKAEGRKRQGLRRGGWGEREHDICDGDHKLQKGSLTVPSAEYRRQKKGGSMLCYRDFALRCFHRD